MPRRYDLLLPNGNGASIDEITPEIAEGMRSGMGAAGADDLSSSIAAEAAARSAGITAEAAARTAADAAFALRTTGNNYGDQSGDTFTITSDPGGAFSALSPPFAASAAGTFRLNEDGEYVPTSGFSGAVENWYDLDLADPASLITVGMLPALLTRLGITYPTP